MNEPLTLSYTPILTSEHWQITANRFDPRALALYKRHYSCHQYKDGRIPIQYVAPGQYLSLLTSSLDALFVWQKSRFRRDKQTGINCAVFRNEGSVLSSLLIAEAVELALRRWGAERLFTFVDASQIRSTNPGYCFWMAGWEHCGETKAGLRIMEYLP